MLFRSRRLQEQKANLEKQRTRFDINFNLSTLEIHRVAEHWIDLIRKHEEAMTKELLKESFETEFSVKMKEVNKELTDIRNSLDFARDILERDNLPEILNVEETLGRRFEDFSLSADFIRDQIELKTPAVQCVANYRFFSEGELGSWLISNVHQK